jgi:hypothetical protein
MKKYLLLGLLVYCGGLRQSLGAVLSETNDGIYVAVYGVGERVGLESKDPFQYDDEFIWCPFSNVGLVRVYFPNPNYAFRIRMISPDGKETRKTPLGQTYGSRFDHLQSEMQEATRGRGIIDAQGRYDASEPKDSFSGRSLPKPNDLFVMDQTGVYKLELEFQISGPHKATDKPGLNFLRFPPMKIKVEKPATAPFFVYSSTNKDTYVSIIGTKSNGLAGFDDGLQWRVSCEKQHSLLHYPDLSSGFKMNLRGPNGKEVARTALGQTIGVNFDAVKNRETLPPGTRLSELSFLAGFPGFGPTLPLPLLKDCFVMDKPGIYTLELQIQLFKIPYDNAMEPGLEELLRFPPMTIKVNCP